MAHYFYTLLTPNGELDRRRGLFDDDEALLLELERRGEELLQYWVIPDFLAKFLNLFKPRLKPSDIAEMCNYLSLYISSGLDLQGAISDLAGNVKSPSLRRILKQLQGHLANGYLPSQAMAITPGIPELVINMAKIGEESGTLDRTMADAAAHIERAENISSSVKRALIYPVFTLVALFAGFLFWMAFVVPKIAELFLSMGMDLPDMTRLLIELATIMDTYWWLIFGMLCALPIAVSLARRLEFFRLQSDRLLWKLPIFGNIIRSSQTAFYFEYLALMYSTGVQITQALQTVAKTSKNAYFRSKVSEINETVITGESLAASFTETKLFDPLILRMIATGEQTGSLEKQLKKISGIYFEKVERLVEVVGKLMEPVIMAILALLFAFFAIALLGPLYDLMSNVGV